MNHQKLSTRICWFLALLSISIFSGVTMANPLVNLKKVGEAKLKVFFWDVYNSSLYSETGQYQAEKFPQVLKIDYLRDIDAVDLIERTQDEWRNLGIKQDIYEQWIPILTNIFPDIKKGDTLLLSVTRDLHSEFFFNGKAIGKISDLNFGKSFLRIWLDVNCSYPKVREQLIGVNK
jgi:hypothetical protein